MTNKTPAYLFKTVEFPRPEQFYYKIPKSSFKLTTNAMMIMDKITVYIIVEAPWL